MNGRPRRRYRTRNVTVENPRIVLMPEKDRPAAIAALSRWFAELLADESFLDRCRGQSERRTEANGHERDECLRSTEESS